MRKIEVITRADDAGSSRSANGAIAEVIKAGYIKNVSIMAPGPHVEEAYSLFGHNKKICFGLHTTFNAEWDQVKWGPVLTDWRETQMLDSHGYFLNNPSKFKGLELNVEEILREVDAQLDKVTKIGFDIRYIDSHMFWEDGIPGMQKALDEWIHKKGLLNHRYYYTMIPEYERLLKNPQSLLRVLESTPNGQYFYVAHPAFNTEEMRLTGNEEISGEQVASDRDMERRYLTNEMLLESICQAGVIPLRYDEAVPLVSDILIINHE